MSIGKTIKKKLTTALKLKKRPRKTYPDMPEDPKELARAMFFPNDSKLKAKRQKEEARGRDGPRP